MFQHPLVMKIAVKLTYVMIYLSKPNDTFVVAPVDYSNLSQLSVLNMKTLYLEYYKAYEGVGSDCPEFMKKVDKVRTYGFFSYKTVNENKHAIGAQRKALLKRLKKVALEFGLHALAHNLRKKVA